MKEKIILSRPGVLMGISTTKAYEDKTVTFYDGDTQVMEVSLNTAHPTKRNLLPGIEKYVFIKHNLRMEYPAEVENDVDVFVSDR